MQSSLKRTELAALGSWILNQRSAASIDHAPQRRLILARHDNDHVAIFGESSNRRRKNRAGRPDEATSRLWPGQQRLVAAHAGRLACCKDDSAEPAQAHRIYSGTSPFNSLPRLHQEQRTPT